MPNYLTVRQVGVSVSAAGDMNGDRFGDLVLGAWLADPSERGEAGSAYLVFRRPSFPPKVDLSALDGSDGFRIDGE